MRNCGAFVLTMGVIIGSCAPGAMASGFELAPGDLLFQDLDCGPPCDAIETVTEGVDGAKFSHLGVISRWARGEWMVLEAVSAGVVETPLSAFLARSADAEGRPKVLVGRLREEYRGLIPDALEFARKQLGRSYDRVYIIGDDAYYCSELVYDMFRTANGGEPVFELRPMTFNDPVAGEPFPAWVDHYAELGVPIPEGEPGINPGGISRADALEIVHAYGHPDGWTPAELPAEGGRTADNR